MPYSIRNLFPKRTAISKHPLRYALAIICCLLAAAALVYYLLPRATLYVVIDVIAAEDDAPLMTKIRAIRVGDHRVSPRFRALVAGSSPEGGGIIVKKRMRPFFAETITIEFASSEIDRGDGRKEAVGIPFSRLTIPARVRAEKNEIAYISLRLDPRRSLGTNNAKNAPILLPLFIVETRNRVLSAQSNGKSIEASGGAVQTYQTVGTTPEGTVKTNYSLPEHAIFRSSL